jgi:hypothetical protein
VLRGLVGDLERRLSAEARRRAALEERLMSARSAAARERAARQAAETGHDAIQRELAVIEASLIPDPPDRPPVRKRPPAWRG